MDEEFKNLEKAGQNDVDHLIKWMKDSNIVDPAKDDENIRELFEQTDANQKIELEKFKEVLDQVATEQHKTVEEMSAQLAAAAPKVTEALEAAKKGFDALKGILKID